MNKKELFCLELKRLADKSRTFDNFMESGRAFLNDQEITKRPPVKTDTQLAAIWYYEWQKTASMHASRVFPIIAREIIKNNKHLQADAIFHLAFSNWNKETEAERRAR